MFSHEKNNHTGKDIYEPAAQQCCLAVLCSAVSLSLILRDSYYTDGIHLSFLLYRMTVIENFGARSFFIANPRTFYIVRNNCSIIKTLFYTQFR